MGNSRFIKSIQLRRELIDDFTKYPFCLAAVRNLKKINLNKQVTFIIGENGSGKSTLLEGLAVAYGFNPEGGTKNFNFHTKETHSELYKYLKIEKGIERPKDGFFFRAESFYNVATEIDKLSEGDRYIDYYGGRSLHEMSHGESFLSLFMNRFFGNGIYLLDEPEAALSPKRQLALMAKMHELVSRNSQFIISTHSPILLAYPESDILALEGNFKKIEYKETEQYQIMKSFLDYPEKMLNELLSNEN